eukprot:gnl/TRDRNA2_/TRDRNA2_119587_c2_seq1.p1 gnl/TRDRNA2_/TRDRNA2_119587_c2~~gnl/TRDRNA2_/TRDRNA2_119587_c2_seq1.p1  ORF type:complete len:197 (+),score=29.46 gnl/TRDRNA2_/TRDRNA2_119587_c2_seq1:1-591(+)
MKAEKEALQAAWVEPERLGQGPIVQPKANEEWGSSSSMGQNAAALKAKKLALQASWAEPERNGQAFYNDYQAPKKAPLGQKAAAITEDKDARQAGWVLPERTGKAPEPAKIAEREPEYQPPQPVSGGSAALGTKAAALQADKVARQSGWTIPERVNKLTGHLATKPYTPPGSPKSESGGQSEAAKWIAAWKANQGA